MGATAVFETECPAVTFAGVFFWSGVGVVRFFGVLGRFGGLRVLWGVGCPRPLSRCGVGVFHCECISVDKVAPIGGSHCLGVE